MKPISPAVPATAHADTPHAHVHAQPHGHDSCCAHAPPVADMPAPAADLGTTVFRIPAMDCAAEESDIRRALDPIAGIRSLGFRLGQRSLAIDAPPEVVALAADAIRRAGFEATAVAGAAEEGRQGGLSGLQRLILALALAIGSELVDYFAPDTRVWKGVGLAVALAAIGLSGFEVYKKGLTALLRGRLNINALMTVAVSGALLIGQWPEAAMVMALYAVAELIEARSVDRARNAIQGLMAMAPEEASVLQADGNWRQVPIGAVPLQARVRVRPGERVPLDGTVTRGSTSIDQAPVTGESIPVDKAMGDAVFAGTINQAGSIELSVTAPASNSTLARIIQAVEKAQGTRAPTQRFVDRFAAVYTPSVFAVALAVAALGPWLLDWTLLQGLYKALVLLVIACPCALVISTPVTVVSGLAAAARRGILVKGGVYLEDARKLKAVALDKTGTLTEGKPRLVEREPIGTSMAQVEAERIAAILAGHSGHPVSRAIAQGLTADATEPQGFAALPGRGVQGEVDGASYVLGNHRLIEERGQCTPALEARLAVHEQAGRTVTLLASDHEVLALFAVADTLKPSSRDAVAELKALGLVPVMLTGDNQATASAIARQAGIDEARGNLLPEDKLGAIVDLQRRHGPTAMTGDGINDAPALAQADIGIAMGAAGTDTAMEAADVVVMNDDLRRVAETVRLSRRTHAVLVQNITLAIGIKAVFLVLAVFGGATMWMAVFADMGASLLVVGNGLRLLRGVRGGSA